MLNVFSEHLNFTSTFLRSYTQGTPTVATNEKLYQDNGIWLMIPNINVCTVEFRNRAYWFLYSISLFCTKYNNIFVIDACSWTVLQGVIKNWLKVIRNRLFTLRSNFTFDICVSQFTHCKWDWKLFIFCRWIIMIKWSEYVIIVFNHVWRGPPLMGKIKVSDDRCKM